MEEVANIISKKISKKKDKYFSRLSGKRKELYTNVYRIEAFINNIKEDEEIHYYSHYINQNFPRYFELIKDECESIKNMEEDESKMLNEKAIEVIKNCYYILKKRIEIKYFVRKIEEETKEKDEEYLNEYYEGNEEIKTLVDSSNKTFDTKYTIREIDEWYYSILNFKYYKKLKNSNSELYDKKRNIIEKKNNLKTKIEGEKGKEYLILLNKKYHYLYEIITSYDERLEFRNLNEIENLLEKLNKNLEDTFKTINEVKIRYDDENEENNKEENNNFSGQIGKGVVGVTGTAITIYSASILNIIKTNWRSIWNMTCRYKFFRKLWRIDNSLQPVLNVLKYVGVTLAVGDIIPLLLTCFSIYCYYGYAKQTYKYCNERDFQLKKIINDFIAEHLCKKKLFIVIDGAKIVIENEYVMKIKEIINEINKDYYDNIIIKDKLVCMIREIEFLLRDF